MSRRSVDEPDGCGCPMQEVAQELQDALTNLTVYATAHALTVSNLPDEEERNIETVFWRSLVNARALLARLEGKCV